PVLPAARVRPVCPRPRMCWRPWGSRTSKPVGRCGSRSATPLPGPTSSGSRRSSAMSSNGLEPRAWPRAREEADELAMQVLAAMSGGVDSAVAAARCVEAGHDVTGVHLALSANPSSFRSGARGCCTLEDSRDARRAADLLGIPLYVWDLAEQRRAERLDAYAAEECAVHHA